jgi:thiamine kinase-like enzyme
MNLIEELTVFFNKTNPLDINEFKIKDLASGEYNCNYLLDTQTNKYVVRVSVSQLTGKADQLEKEFSYLKYLENRSISPSVYLLDMNGFKYPYLIEEFVEGSVINNLDSNTLSKIANVIARINNVDTSSPGPFEYKSIDYKKDIEKLDNVFKSLKPNEYSKKWNDETHDLFIAISKLLVNNEPDAKTMLVRRDANPRNFIFTKDDIRMVDWELAWIGDPTITLASFINELITYDVLNLNPTQEHIDFVIKTFLSSCPIVNFEELLKNRLMLERLGGLVWGLERIDNLINGKSIHTDDRLNWYQDAAEKSLQALKISIN